MLGSFFSGDFLYIVRVKVLELNFEEEETRAVGDSKDFIFSMNCFLCLCGRLSETY